MSEPAGSAYESDESEPDLARELTAIPYEPLLPVEKKLIVWSLVLGVVLLGLLLWASATFFPTTARAAALRHSRPAVHSPSQSPFSPPPVAEQRGNPCLSCSKPPRFVYTS
jgi:hypothetical protein